LTPQFLINHEKDFPGFVVRAPNGAATLLILAQANLGRLIQEGWDYEMAYSFETARLGHGDWGKLNATLNGTYIDRVVLQAVPGGPEQSVVGKFQGGFLDPRGGSGGAFTHNRAYASLIYTGPTDSWLRGVDTGFTVHYIGQYWDDRRSTFFSFQPAPPGAPPNKNGRPRIFVGNEDRKIREWITLDFLVNYTFNFPAAAAQNEVAGYAKNGVAKMEAKKERGVTPVSTAEYNLCGWRAWLNNTTVTVGINNVLNEEPPFVAGSVEDGYDYSTANIKGRIWYVALKKRF
jgi:hypothetical protein